MFANHLNITFTTYLKDLISCTCLKRLDSDNKYVPESQHSLLFHLYCSCQWWHAVECVHSWDEPCLVKSELCQTYHKGLWFRQMLRWLASIKCWFSSIEADYPSDTFKAVSQLQTFGLPECVLMPWTTLCQIYDVLAPGGSTLNVSFRNKDTFIYCD